MSRVTHRTSPFEYRVYVSKHGNVFMTEIAALIAAGLTDCGRSVIYPAPGLPEPGRNRINLVVAPHEFFVLFTGATEAELRRAASHSVCIGVEQPGTEWFERGFDYAREARAILDISPLAVDEVFQRGYEAEHLLLGYHPSWDRWSRAHDRDRTTDVIFLGAITKRRDTILGDASRHLWEWESEFHLFDVDRPIQSSDGSFLTGSKKWYQLANSRILLNIHRGEVPYFEWVRALEAIVNGCLIVTEPSIDYGPLIPGEHLVAVPSELLGAYTTSLLVDERRRSSMAESAYDLIRSKFEMASLLRSTCSKLEDGSAYRKHRSAVSAIQPTVTTSNEEQATVTRHPSLIDALDIERQVGTRVKKLLDDETILIRQIEQLQSFIAHGEFDHINSVTTSTWDAVDPEVSVIITCYNYSSVIRTAIDSVVSSVGISAEVIVVEDHSSDDSLDTIYACLRALDWFPIKVVARAANGGLSAARNLGAQHARTDKLFMLDADNWIFPRCLRVLARELDARPETAFAYGIIVKHGDVGLVSALPWDIKKLARSNYIDAMAMIRRSAFDAVGGYDAAHGVWGWEDYELWLRMADSGYYGTLVPTLIGTYEVHEGSMIETVNLDGQRMQEQLRMKYQFLDRESSDCG